MFKRILLTTDFSAAAAWAAIHASHLCRLFGSGVLIQHVFDPTSGDDAEAQARERLAVLQQSRFHEVDDVQLIAAPASHAHAAICEVASNHAVDLIVAGRHGEHSLSERLLGSTTERVVRHAPCSVLVAHPTQHEHLIQFKHLLVGSDLSERSESALKAAAAIAAKLSSYVTLLHIFDIMPSLELLQEPHDLNLDTSMSAMLADKLETLRKTHLDNVPAETRVLRDKSTVVALCDYASDHHADLMVLGTHGMTGLSRFLIGSVAERAVRHAPCSVLVTR